MLEPKFRRWNYFTQEEIRAMAETTTSESIWNGTIDSFQTVCSEKMAGKRVCFRLENGERLDYEFLDRRYLLWSVNGKEPVKSVYNASPAPGYEELQVIHHYREGLDVPAAITLYADMETGYVTSVRSEVGRNSNTPRDCSNEILFGEIEGIAHPEGSVKPHFTNDLTGKAVFWGHPETPERPSIKYLFSSPFHYTYVMRFAGENTYWTGTNPTDYIWMRKGLYLAVYIEEHQAGFHIETLMNLEIMRDVQCGFGLGLGKGDPKDRPDCMEMTMRSGRHGRWATLDTIFD